MAYRRRDGHLMLACRTYSNDAGSWSYNGLFTEYDLYEEKTFDEWLETSTKREILNDLEEKWQRETNGNAVFISAIEKRNLDDLRKKILDKVRVLYKLRYPYKEVHF